MEHNQNQEIRSSTVSAWTRQFGPNEFDIRWILTLMESWLHRKGQGCHYIYPPKKGPLIIQHHNIEPNQ
jgi:hypothetical protein